MPSSIYFPSSQRTNGGFREKGRMTGNGLPTYSSAVQEKLHRHSHSPSWFTAIPIPITQRRRVRILFPNFARLYRYNVTRFGKGRGSALFLLTFCIFVFTIVACAKRIFWHHKEWSIPIQREPPTLVFRRGDLQRIWKWEIESGHYPSRRDIPEMIRMTEAVKNPALPPISQSLPSRFRPPTSAVTRTEPAGPARVYPDIRNLPPHVAYPPRPPPGSTADLDVVMDNCDFSEKKYVRDCLEVLRLGGGLDAKNRVRRGRLDNWRYIYTEDVDNKTQTYPKPSINDRLKLNIDTNQESEEGLVKKRGTDWEPPLTLPPPLHYKSYSELSTPCDPENPRIFHMYWTGPFTDKPYMALISFLYTQNTGLHLRDESALDAQVCRPQFWVWVSPGPAALPPKKTALKDMFNQLKSSPWAAPFLHPRFDDVIQFKLWNTTEQLDGVPEIKDEWRKVGTLFNSGGYKMDTPAKKEEKKQEPMNEAVDPQQTAPSKDKDDDDPTNLLGTTSSANYDRFSVVLSDMARFILCHRFGGVYVDADTIFLRDWEDLFGWKGAFAYRWSRLEKYNTAVLHLNKGSALGSFLFRTALNHDLDFHPMSVSRYTKDAYLEGLLLRLPDAMFDSAWLNTEDYQMDRPPQPFITSFSHFFEPPVLTSAAPQALGIDGFFKGAYSYHFHNNWWTPFDPARNWPDLGPTFIAGERVARAKAEKVDVESLPDTFDDKVEHDLRDLSWATVLKRTFEGYIRGERPNMYGEWIVGLDKK